MRIRPLITIIVVALVFSSCKHSDNKPKGGKTAVTASTGDQTAPSSNGKAAPVSGKVADIAPTSPGKPSATPAPGNAPGNHPPNPQEQFLASRPPEYVPDGSVGGVVNGIVGSVPTSASSGKRYYAKPPRRRKTSEAGEDDVVVAEASTRRDLEPARRQILMSDVEGDRLVVGAQGSSKASASKAYESREELMAVIEAEYARERAALAELRAERARNQELSAELQAERAREHALSAELEAIRGNEQPVIANNRSEKPTRSGTSSQASTSPSADPTSTKSAKTQASASASQSIPAVETTSRATTSASTRPSDSAGTSAASNAAGASNRDGELRATTPPHTGTSTGIAPPTQPAIQRASIPAGTQLSIRLTEEINSKKAQPGDKFSGYLALPIIIDGHTVAVRNAVVEGQVVEVKSPARGDDKPLLTLKLTRLITKDRSYSIATHTRSDRKSTVANEAASGALVGALDGGGKGAAIGSILGGNSTAGSDSDKEPEVVLRPGSVIHFTLEDSVTVTLSDK